MRNKKRNRIFLLLIILLGVTVGYAILSTTLKIRGVSNITASSFNIHWDNVANEDGVNPIVSAYIKDSAKTVVEYNVNFSEPGDYYEFTVDAVNEGTIDGEIKEITSLVNGDSIDTLPDYIKYSVKYLDGGEVSLGDVLAKKTNNTPTRKTYKVRIEFDADLFTNEDLEAMPEDGVEYLFDFKVVYGQRGVTAPNLNDLEWDEIVENIEEDPEEYPVGSTKEIEMDMDDDGVNETYTLRISNTSTPSVCKGSFSETGCGVVLEFVDVLFVDAYTYTDYATDNYTSGDLYNDHLKNNASEWIYNKLPSDLRVKIIPTRVVTGRGMNSSETVSNDKIFLLSATEIWGTNGRITNDTAADRTRQLDYYREKKVTTDANYEYARKKKGEIYYTCWTRTPFKTIANYYYYVSNSGEFGRWRGSGRSYGVAPAFRIG